jgi:hypothetical protein
MGGGFRNRHTVRRITFLSGGLRIAFLFSSLEHSSQIPSVAGCGPNLHVTPPSWRLLCRLESGATSQNRTASVAEPWFLIFNANCHLRPAMNPEDLAKSGWDGPGK